MFHIPAHKNVSNPAAQRDIFDNTMTESRNNQTAIDSSPIPGDLQDPRNQQRIPIADARHLGNEGLSLWMAEQARYDAEDAWLRHLHRAPLYR